MGRSYVWVLVFVMCLSPAVAQQPAKKPCSSELHEQFAFWAGVWDVATKDGTVVGENEITSQRCMLVENWKGNKGSRGMSLNFVDPADGRWTQDWVDNSGGRILIKGGWEDGSMRLVGEHILPDGTKRPFRGTWTPLPDGRVRQFFEEVADAEKGWAPWFEGFYKKRSSD